jgi:hexosaminidase
MRARRVVVLMCGVSLVGMATLEAKDAVVHDLMPAPASVELLEGGFPLEGTTVRAAVVGPPNDRIERGIERLVSRLAVRAGSPLAIEIIEDPGRASLVVDCPSSLARPFPSLEDDESYRLSVTPAGIRLEAAGPLGALRGLATLAQLATPDGEGWVLRGAEIEDAV